MPNFYYSDKANKPVGPFDDEQLSALFKQGKVEARTHVIKEGAQQWNTFEQVFPTVVLNNASPSDAPVVKAEPAVPPPPSANKLPITAEAIKLLKKVKTETSEFDSHITVIFPDISRGILGSTDAFFRSVKPKEPSQELQRLVAARGLFVGLYVVARPDKLLSYDTAHLDGGQQLECKYIKADAFKGFWKIHLSVTVPEEVLFDRAATGFNVRISKPREGQQLVVTVPASHVQAVLAYHYPERFDLKTPAPDTGNQNEGKLNSRDKRAIGVLFLFVGVLFMLTGLGLVTAEGLWAKGGMVALLGSLLTYFGSNMVNTGSAWQSGPIHRTTDR